jgi:predicted O-linked N-acetylglucosamine transferase (SPINDLY family)
MSGTAAEAGLHFSEGVAAQQGGDLGRAETFYARAVALDPQHVGALHNLAVLRANAGRALEAMELLRQAVLADPTTPETRFNLGTLFLTHGQVEVGASELAAALALRPDYPEALVNLARARVLQNDADAAMELLLKAEALAPHYAPALTNLGALFMARGAYREAGQRYALVLHLDPGSAEAAYNVANALKALGRQDEAIAYYDQALARDRTYVDALINRANALRELERLDEAVETYGRALRLKPDSALLHLNLGQILRDRGDAEDARAALARALELDPEDAHAQLAAVMAELPLVYAEEAEVGESRARYAKGLEALAAWASTPERRGALARAVGMSQPFYLAYQAQNDRELQSAYGALVCSVAGEAFPLLPPPAAPAAGERIRVGIVSGFFRAHSNWKIPIRGWLEALDRSRFEVIGYQTNARRDACTEAAERLCDRFVQGPLSNDGWRERIGRDAPHVLIYPEIGMDPTTPRLAAQRLAPVQCASWGHPDTTGLPTIDLYLSSALMEPEEAQAAYTERLVRLPGLGVRLEPPAAAEPADRAALGLRKDAAVFWCGQSLPKYLPRWDAVWPRIAQAAGACQFVFIGLPQASAAERVFRARLARAFAHAGLDVDQYCVFLPRMSEAEFSSAMAAADVFLDSLEWSGCNSTLEAIAHDLPVVTWPVVTWPGAGEQGGLMRGRHSAAILQAIDATATVAHDLDDYVAIAARLATDAAWRAEIRARVVECKARLWRDDAAVRALEDVLEQAVRG